MKDHRETATFLLAAMLIMGGAVIIALEFRGISVMPWSPLAAVACILGGVALTAHLLHRAGPI